MKPMMSDKEIEIIEGLLKPEFDCFEYGAGFSTLYFSKLVKSWESHEHDIKWFDIVKTSIKDNTIVHLIPKEQKQNYVKLKREYDFILVDGLYRKECLHEAIKHLKPNGKVIVHDACRLEYKDWINDFPNLILIEGEILDPNDKNYYLHRGIRIYDSIY